MKTKLFFVLAVLLVSFMSSCSVGYTPNRGLSYGRPGMGMSGGAYGGRQGAHAQTRSELSGHMMQKRHSDGTPDGAPFWVPAGTDLNAKFGKVNTKAEVHVPGQELQNFLAKYQQQPQQQ